MTNSERRKALVEKAVEALLERFDYDHPNADYLSIEIQTQHRQRNGCLTYGGYRYNLVNDDILHEQKTWMEHSSWVFVHQHNIKTKQSKYICEGSIGPCLPDLNPEFE